MDKKGLLFDEINCSCLVNSTAHSLVREIVEVCKVKLHFDNAERIERKHDSITKVLKRYKLEFENYG